MFLLVVARFFPGLRRSRVGGVGVISTPSLALFLIGNSLRLCKDVIVVRESKRSIFNVVVIFNILNDRIFKIVDYLCDIIQVEIFNVSEIRSLFVYHGLDFFFIKV
jgi:hypothetical protein